MNATRPLTFVTGVAVLGLGAALIARSILRGAAETPERDARAGVAYGRGARIEKVIAVARPASDVYAAWRDLARLPEIMSHLERVEVLDEQRSHWSAKGPGGLAASWDAEIIEDRLNERIAWRSVGGAVPNAGSVSFEERSGQDETAVRGEMEWAPPGGSLGTSFANLLGGDPAGIVERDLRRFKTRMESGQAAAGLDGIDVTT